VLRPATPLSDPAAPGFFYSSHGSRRTGRYIDDAVLAHVWPAHHESVQFYGNHSVDVDGELAKRDADGYRPLRAITGDGTLIAVVRFESAEAAQRNAARPGQQAWWQQMKSHFTGPVVFRDCPDVMVLGRGGSDDAKFVQVIQGRVRDRGRTHATAEQANQYAGLFSAHRPDMIGAIRAIDDEGYLTETLAFTSEADASWPECMRWRAWPMTGRRTGRPASMSYAPICGCPTSAAWRRRAAATATRTSARSTRSTVATGT
jgi:hypothetical protein